MTDDNSNLVDMDLDSFSTTFFGKDEPVVTEPVDTDEDGEDKEDPETEDNALATEPTEPTDEDQEDDTDKEPEEKPAKPVKKTAQDRINEVVAKQREAERERDALRQEVATLKATAPKPEVAKTDGPKPLREQLDADQPSPDEQNEDGTPKYKLGEFDPMYIRDLTRYTIAAETAVAKEEKAAEDQRKTVEAAQAELQASWLQKLEAVEEDIPDIREQITGVQSAFADIEPGYGEFLAATIMSCDNGPEIMAYLSQNIGEAQKIVASGPAAATLALGRLDAKFVKAAVAPDEKRNKKQSAAPNPPEAGTRGAGGRFSVAPDTSDLAAFEREYYGKK